MKYTERRSFFRSPFCLVYIDLFSAEIVFFNDDALTRRGGVWVSGGDLCIRKYAEAQPSR